MRSEVISSQRARRASTMWKRLQAAVWLIWIISESVNWNRARCNDAPRRNSRRKRAEFIRSAVPVPCTSARTDHSFAADQSDFERPVSFDQRQQRYQAVARKVHLVHRVARFIQDLTIG